MRDPGVAAAAAAVHLFLKVGVRKAGYPPAEERNRIHTTDLVHS